ncbi:hypothetical protein M885DRAFT_573240 [Pelagophyceae sp. CCMP2097]|nr:hypothetical protein M885DRAFT_573240 [Pelagophyceae sp. CCMP2097]
MPCGLALVLLAAADALRVDFGAGYTSYTVTHKGKQLFASEDFALFFDGHWHSSRNGTLHLDSAKNESDDDAVGAYEGVQLSWRADKEVVWTTTAKTYNTGVDVAFSSAFPRGLNGTASGSVVTHFPAFSKVPGFTKTLSWAGSFVQPVWSTPLEMSSGARGGPAVFHGDDNTVLVASPMDHFKAWSEGNGTTWDDTPAWAPGPAGTIVQIPAGFEMNHLLHVGSSITAAVKEWGDLLKSYRGFQPKMFDVTLDKLGYQTDNGAFYCFCKDSNCSDTLIRKVAELSKYGAPPGYLSFQGAGASAGSGDAPWCVSEWGVDGGLGPTYPLSVKELQNAIGVPLQLYAPYFCPDSPYFDGDGAGDFTKWPSVRSDETLQGCHGYDFVDVSPEASRDFYAEFFDRGIGAGMVAFEPDFMNQNANCVPAFLQSATNATKWQRGMADAALDRGVALQWCYATPTDVLASLDMRAVTNFRTSNDFCYGDSYDIGASSLLVWALGAHPSKDTLWTSANGGFEVPGCPWTRDHEEAASGLHLVLALMSTGPVGVSDGLGMTNYALLRRTISADGTLLRPTKALTALDATLARRSDAPKGDVYSTFSAVGELKVHQLVSFRLTEAFEAHAYDFYPALDTGVWAVRHDGVVSKACRNNTRLDDCGICLVRASQRVRVPPSDFANVTAGTDLAPTLTNLWPACASGWVVLGDLSKFVPLSARRFTAADCKVHGASVNLVGSPAERVTVTFISPQNLTVNVDVVIPKGGEATARVGR